MSPFIETFILLEVLFYANFTAFSIIWTFWFLDVFLLFIAIRILVFICSKILPLNNLHFTRNLLSALVWRTAFLNNVYNLSISSNGIFGISRNVLK